MLSNQNHRHFDVNRAIDLVKRRLNLRSDVELARLLGITPPQISKIRGYHAFLSSGLLIGLHEASGIEIKELQRKMGERRMKWRISCPRVLPDEVARQIRGERENHILR